MIQGQYDGDGSKHENVPTDVTDLTTRTKSLTTPVSERTYPRWRVMAFPLSISNMQIALGFVMDPVAACVVAGKKTAPCGQS